ncbi:ATV_HP_G0013790.mRNA.1.CDS.1 [Saccharomyces cerevisiae]|nr:ATV_HP_G0013790.mRNA.1.CDS.1 [Saccharomyces cerevisiae]CAI6948672.1 ATV_HP_G0013790.mRNA.1.CDS.1 [Saccharomyces cerevisiae]
MNQDIYTKRKRRCFGPILFIWDDCIIGNNSIIDHSLIASNATLGSNVRLNDGCIIGFNVKIDDNMDLDRNTKYLPVHKNAGSRCMIVSNEQFDEDMMINSCFYCWNRVLVIFTKARCILTMKIVLQKPAKNKHFE